MLWAIMLIIYPGALSFYSLINIVSVFILMSILNEYNWKNVLLFYLFDYDDFEFCPLVFLL